MFCPFACVFLSCSVLSSPGHCTISLGTRGICELMFYLLWQICLVPRVVPIPIPVSEIAPILPKMLASVSATTGVQAPIRYHLIYSISNLITGYWGCDRDTSRTGGRRGGRGGGCAIAIQPGPTTDVHGHEEKKIIYIYIYIYIYYLQSIRICICTTVFLYCSILKINGLNLLYLFMFYKEFNLSQALPL